jgi:hypothetical protein
MNESQMTRAITGIFQSDKRLALQDGNKCVPMTEERLRALRMLIVRYETAHAAALYWRDVAQGKRENNSTISSIPDLVVKVLIPLE